MFCVPLNLYFTGKRCIIKKTVKRGILFMIKGLREGPRQVAPLEQAQPAMPRSVSVKDAFIQGDGSLKSSIKGEHLKEAHPLTFKTFDTKQITEMANERGELEKNPNGKLAQASKSYSEASRAYDQQSLFQKFLSYFMNNDARGLRVNLGEAAKNLAEERSQFHQSSQANDQNSNQV
jgi:hypothetical protein